MDTTKEQRLDLTDRFNPFTACRCTECGEGEVRVIYTTIPHHLECDRCKSTYSAITGNLIIYETIND